VGIIGFCSWGRQVYLAACTLRGIDAAIDCYGGGVVAKPEELTMRQPVAPIDYTKDLRCPLLGLLVV
jgi:carboxymethylenebutenolidase